MIPERADSFLAFNEYKVLANFGRIIRQQAEQLTLMLKLCSRLLHNSLVALISVANWQQQLSKELQDGLKSSLPSIEDIEHELKQLESEEPKHEH